MTMGSNLSAIRLAIKTRIETALGSSIQRVIIGPRAPAANFNPPLIWVQPDDGQIADKGFALTEDWGLFYWLISVIKVKSSLPEDMEEATATAEALVLRASGALLVNPNTGLEDRRLDGLVEDITRIGWAPADSRILEGDESLYGAAIRIKLRLTNQEVE